MKKSLLMVYLIIFLLLFCSCRKDSDDDIKEIIFHHYFSGTLKGGVDGLVSVFNTNFPKYRLKAEPVDHESFKTSIRNTLAKGNPPDLYAYWAGYRVQTILEYLQPIDDIWQENNLDEYFDEAIINSAVTYEGKKYLMPVTRHYVAFFYNKKIFEQLKITPPVTWDQFLATCELIKAGGVVPLSLGSKERWPAQFWFDYLLLRTAGPGYRTNLLEGNSKYTDPEVRKAFSIWADLMEKGCFNSDPNALDWAGGSDLVYSGECAMTLMGTWIIPYFNDDDHGWVGGEDYDFFSFPIVTAGVPKVALGPIDGIIIPAKAANPYSAKLAIVQFAGDEYQKVMSRGSGALAPSQKVNPDFYSDLQKRINDEISTSQLWHFNYDLATPPEAAEYGLNAFYEFVHEPAKYNEILNKTENGVKTVFGY